MVRANYSSAYLFLSPPPFPLYTLLFSFGGLLFFYAVTDLFNSQKLGSNHEIGIFFFLLFLMLVIIIIIIFSFFCIFIFVIVFGFYVLLLEIDYSMNRARWRKLSIMHAISKDEKGRFIKLGKISRHKLIM